MPKSSAFEKGFSTIRDCSEMVQDEAKPRRLLLRQLIKSWMLVWVSGKKEFNMIAQFYDLKEVAAEIAAVAVAPDTKAEIRFNALATLVNLGSKKELDTLDKLLKNEDKVPAEFFQSAPGGFDGRLPKEWRDLALLVMIRIAGDNPVDYGFAMRYADSQPSRYDLDLAFSVVTEQKAALKKWQARAKKLDPAPPK